jgi:hypothetical protein
MDKIANSKELQAELTKLLAYSKTERPSRVLIARDLATLSIRLGGEIPPQFLENIKKKKEESKDSDDKDEDKDQE